MIRTPRYRIEVFIKDKETFSIPMIQSDLGLDYGEIREIISDLVDEEKVEFLEGIVYKSVESKEEKDDDSSSDNNLFSWDDLFSDDDDDDDNNSNNNTDTSSKNTPFWLDSLMSDDDDEENKKTEDEDDDSSSVFSDFLKAMRSINSINANDIFNSIVSKLETADVDKLMESNGGPLPDLNDGEMPLSFFTSNQKEYDSDKNTFRPKIDIFIPESNNPLVIHVAESVNDESDYYFHDNGTITDYIRSLAEGLNKSTVNSWQKLIEKWLEKHGLNGRYEDGHYKYYVPGMMTHESFHRALSCFVADVMKIVDIIDMIIRYYKDKCYISPISNSDLAERLLQSDISFESITEFFNEIISIDPMIDANTINHMFLRCAIAAIRQNHPKKNKIMDLSREGRKNSGALAAIYLIIRDVTNALNSGEGEE